MKTYVCLAISIVFFLSFDVSANSSFFEVQSDSQELVQFKQDARTHVFPDNGLSWLDKREYIMTGEITEKGCHFSDVSTSTVREIEVEEAVNRATCQSLVAKGTLTRHHVAKCSDEIQVRCSALRSCSHLLSLRAG